MMVPPPTPNSPLKAPAAGAIAPSRSRRERCAAGRADGSPNGLADIGGHTTAGGGPSAVAGRPRPGGDHVRHRRPARAQLRPGGLRVGPLGRGRAAARRRGRDRLRRLARRRAARARGEAADDRRGLQALGGRRGRLRRTEAARARRRARRLGAGRGALGRRTAGDRGARRPGRGRRGRLHARAGRPGRDVRFRDLLRVSVLLFGGSASALAVVSVVGAADEETNTLVYVAAAWWCLATLAGLWLGGRGVATPGGAPPPGGARPNETPSPLGPRAVI